MKLFEDDIDSTINYLPKDGEVNYYGTLLSESSSDVYFNTLMQTIPWENDEVILFGKKIITSRKVAWFSDNGIHINYSNTTKTPRSWTSELLELKSKVEEKTGVIFNSCLLNLYHNGEESMGWHSDGNGENDLLKNRVIASLSLGAQRKFVFKHKLTNVKVNCILDNGSLLIMKGETQKYWLHSLPLMKAVRTPRINLTFRQVG